MQTAARIEDILGKPEIAEDYRKRGDAVRAAVHSAFFNPADNSYVNGFPAYLAIALVVNLPPQELRPAVWQRLEEEILVNDKGHIHAGITGGAFLFKALMENNRNDLIYAMVSKEDYPGWGDMLKQGATTFWEDWGSRWSRLHSSYLYAGSWFIEGPGGIRNPEGAGFKHFTIEPWIDSRSGLRNVAAHYDSLYGRIAVSWRLEGDEVRLRLTIPPNTEATLILNNVNPDSIWESGWRLNQVVGVTLMPGNLNSAKLRLEPGQYEFQARVYKRVL